MTGESVGVDGQDGLVAFVRARLDKDEQIARAAGDYHGRGMRWNVLDPDRHPGVVGDGRNVVTYGLGVGGSGTLREHAAHIARHDPDRELREVEAKRRMLDDYATTCRLRDEAAERIRAAGDRPDAKDLDTWDRAQREAAIYEPWVRLLAAPYADHEDYREEEWKP